MTTRFKPYPSYKDSGVEWLGRIPVGWEAWPLKHLTQFINGAAFKPADWGNKGVPIIRIENLNGVEEFNRTTLTVNRRYEVQKGDILFGWSGNRGTSFGPFIWPREGLFYLNQHIFRLEGFQAHRGWFYWMLKAVTFYVEQQAHGIIGLVHITKGDLGVIKIPRPSPNEQQTIASFLDRETGKIDALVKKQERLIELLQEKRTALISHAVTQGLNPNAPKKDSGIPWLGKIPEHWEIVRLGRKIELQRGIDITKEQQSEGSVPVVSSGGVSSYHDKAFALGPGVIVGRKGTAGAVHYVESDYWPHDTTLYVREFRGNHPRFVFHKLCSMDLASFDTGTANPTLNRNLIHPVIVAWPSIEEQSVIADYIDGQTAKLDALMAKVRTAIEQLQEYRTALISAAVTGQIDVRWRP